MSQIMSIIIKRIKDIGNTKYIKDYVHYFFLSYSRIYLNYFRLLNSTWHIILMTKLFNLTLINLVMRNYLSLVMNEMIEWE